MSDLNASHLTASCGHPHQSPPSDAVEDRVGNTVIDYARRYMARGYVVTPLREGSKAPIHKNWTTIRLSESELLEHFRGSNNIGLVLGEPSGWLVDVDLDCPEAVELARRLLPFTAVKTGRASSMDSHWWYVCCGAKTVKHTDPVTKKMIVELRSTGLQTAVGPSIHPSGEMYSCLEGEPAVVGVEELTAAVVALYQAVCDRRGHKSKPVAAVPTESRTALIASDSSVLKRATAYLDAMPGAVSGAGGHNQTYAAATAMVHGFGLAPEVAFRLLLEQYNPRCEPPWSEKELMHKVDDAATKPHERPHGWLRDSGPTGPSDVDHSAVVFRECMPMVDVASQPVHNDPGLLPSDAVRVPGFIGEVMDHCLATAPYPNPTLAFSGALALQAFLAGRKVRDPGDNRTNIYLLGLAHSASGKDWPRKINTRVLYEVGLGSSLGDRLASGEGIQDALCATPSMLFQTDEIDGMLQSMNRSHDARFESIMGTLLTMYSSSNAIYPMRAKAGQSDRGVIDQPSLVLFGTAIPNHYYSALSERMLTNGLFARMLILESGPRGAGQEPTVSDLPDRVLDTAKYWAAMPTDEHSTSSFKPRIVQHDTAAGVLLVEIRQTAERAYNEAEARSDAVGTTVWGRVSEQTRKLALLYAISENHASPLIGVNAVRWASRLVMHQTKRMLFMAATHVAETHFDGVALRLMQKLREAPNRSLPHSVLLKRMKMDARSFETLIGTLEQRGDVRVQLVTTPGRTAKIYHLVVNEGE